MPDKDAPKGTLDSVNKWVKDQGKKQESRSTPMAWVTSLIVGAVALLAVGFMYWRSWKQGRELAKLKHEKDVAVQGEIRAKAQSALDENNKAAAVHSLSVQKSKQLVEKLEGDLKAIEARKVKTDAEINALKSWDDVDRYLESGDDPDPPGTA